MTKEIKQQYKSKKKEITQRLKEFTKLPKQRYKNELQFCLLTPQSKATSCWQAIQQLNKLKNPTKTQISNILKKHTRFHNNKTSHLQEANKNWPKIKNNLDHTNKQELRNWLADNIKGLGMKEASHFLRNIGKSNNQVAILDRHILKNLHNLKLLKQPRITSNKHYLKTENTFIALANYLKIPADHLDLLFWSNETGEVFK